MLTQPAIFNLGGRFMARWSADDKRVISQAKETLSGELKGQLSAYCTHVKDHGGVKKSLRLLARVIPGFRYAARFDVARYYESIEHDVLLSQLKKLQVSQHNQDIVQQYLALPDRRNSGRGMIAGGSLSPLLGAVMLTPLDKIMEAEIRTGRIWYIRYMDDFLVLAKTRHQFRKAIKQVHAVMRQLKLTLHKEQKCFIGKTESGFDFLGYQVCPRQQLHPSAESIKRLTHRYRRLYEQGVSLQRLRQYVVRWCCWLWGGLQGRVSREGGIDKYWLLIETKTTDK
jgi:RNA-directed DNA polymerase